METGFRQVSLRISGHEVRVRLYFSKSHIECPTLLALHGFTGSGEDFQPLRAALRDSSFNWICPDFMGHGCSDHPANIDPYRLSATLELIDRARTLARDANRVRLLGYSMGGRLALHYLLRAVPLPSVVIGASPGLDNPVDRAARRCADSRLIDPESTDLAEFCQMWERNPLIEPQTRLPEPLRSVLANRRRLNHPIGLANSLAGIGTGSLPNIWPALEELPPVTCVHGELDSKFADIAHRMADINPRFTCISIPDCGHAPHLENPQALASVLKNQFA